MDREVGGPRGAQIFVIIFVIVVNVCLLSGLEVTFFCCCSCKVLSTYYGSRILQNGCTQESHLRPLIPQFGDFIFANFR